MTGSELEKDTTNHKHPTDDVKMTDAEEMLKLKSIQAEAAKRMSTPAVIPAELKAGGEATSDERSVFVGNVDYGSTSGAIEHVFEKCGSVVRVTILKDNVTMRPKGFAYVEFADKEGAQKALGMNGANLFGRSITVAPKRANLPGSLTANWPSARGGAYGRGGRGGIRGGGYRYVNSSRFHLRGWRGMRGNARFGPY